MTENSNSVRINCWVTLPRKYPFRDEGVSSSASRVPSRSSVISERLTFISVETANE
ncbi:hypothetical protein O3V59_16000 [Brevibacillus thermoruber]|uniref:Uncharacterized protein n=1 Tax=Brevibacillus thermoruber TaxID=33942 RepID=A0A9X3TTJ5_9BACL|nr:hypothetical protein [Brevibacillus thermoruber]MDA5109870.1 hypothetical protein [Brevibacillus thermoruber]